MLSHNARATALRRLRSIKEDNPMSLEKIMVADDDQNICELLRLYLEKEQYTVVIANDGNEAIAKFNSENPALILLDIMMPGLDGWQVCREIRKKSNVPIIMITAKGETFDKVLGLELGADDYVVKPFDAKEIVARIKAVLRRVSSGTQAENAVREVSYDKLVVNMTRYELKVDGKVVDTPPKELELLFHLASNPNRVYTRDQLLDEVWGFEYYGDSRTVDVHIKRLREKLAGASDKWELKTLPVRCFIGVAGAALCASGGKRSRLGMGNWLLGDGSGGSVFTCPGIGQRF